MDASDCKPDFRKHIRSDVPTSPLLSDNWYMANNKHDAVDDVQFLLQRLGEIQVPSNDAEGIRLAKIG